MVAVINHDVLQFPLTLWSNKKPVEPVDLVNGVQTIAQASQTGERVRASTVLTS